MEFQVKVEQVKDKWITFIVSSEYPRFRKYSFEDISRSQELFEWKKKHKGARASIGYIHIAIGKVRVLMSELCVETCVVLR